MSLMAPNYSPNLTTGEDARMPVSPRSNSSLLSDHVVLKVDSPSEKQMAELVATEQGDPADDLEMDDEEDIEDHDEDSGRPYKRLCRGRESALTLAMTDANKKSVFSKPIIVRVGGLTNSQDFHVHPARLAATSPYFAGLLDEHIEDDAPLELPQDDPIVFQLYAHYMYDKRSVASLDLSTSNAALDSPSAAYDTYIDLLQAYIFGEKIQDPDFSDEIMNRILQCIGNMHNSKTSPKSVDVNNDDDLPPSSSSENIVRPLVELLYPSLPPDSIGRGLVVETFIVLWSHSDMLQNFVPHLSRELLTEIAEMLLSGDKDHIRDAWAQAVDGDYSYYHSARYDEH